MQRHGGLAAQEVRLGVGVRAPRGRCDQARRVSELRGSAVAYDGDAIRLDFPELRHGGRHHTPTLHPAIDARLLATTMTSRPSPLPLDAAALLRRHPHPRTTPSARDAATVGGLHSAANVASIVVAVVFVCPVPDQLNRDEH